VLELSDAIVVPETALVVPTIEEREGERKSK
jgi:hypothetical protein